MASLSVNLATQVSQRTTLTAVQRQSVELLQLTGPELLQAVDEALAANPFLEAAGEESFETAKTSEEASKIATQPENSERAFFDDSAGVAADFERSKESAVLSWKKTNADDEAEERREEVRGVMAQPPDEVCENAEGQEDEQAVPKAEGRGAEGFDVGPRLLGMPPAYPRFGNQS